MKYLKKFENKNESLIQDLNDIFLDLKDDYFEVSIESRNSRLLCEFYISILKYESHSMTCEFYLKEIYETILHVISYMNLNEFELESVDAYNLKGHLNIDNPKNWNISDLNKKALRFNLYFD
jgi:hypothetical protein